jgi:hypothetical protein
VDRRLAKLLDRRFVGRKVVQFGMSGEETRPELY